jgi:molybdate-binding protein
MQFSLDFVPIVRERFDLLLDRREYFEPALQRFLAFCRSAKFAARAEQMSGYDIRGFGTVHLNG